MRLVATSIGIPGSSGLHPAASFTHCVLAFGPSEPERVAQDFADPLEARISYANLADRLPSEFGAGAETPGFFLTAFKKAENDDGYILRGYASGTPAQWPRMFQREDWTSTAVNLIEDSAAAAAQNAMRPFEIRTVRLRHR